MSALSAVSTTQLAASSSAAASKNMVDYTMFLKLLVTEMRNQDPTKPMDSTEYVAQLANFSNVEQSVQTNKKLEQILQGTTISQAGSLIGHTLTSADGAVSGLISQIRIYDDGLTAVLADGREVPVTSGVSIS
jgi:flagellar basal-body rod modification protein FlgD